MKCVKIYKHEKEKSKQICVLGEEIVSANTKNEMMNAFYRKKVFDVVYKNLGTESALEV